jgi:hypothetical protein
MQDLGFRGVAVLFALSWLIFPGFGLIDLSTTWDPGWPVVLEAGWGLLFTVFVGGAFAALAIRPRHGPAVVQLIVVAVALAVSAATGLEGGVLVLAVVIAVEALVFLAVPHRESIRPTPIEIWRPLGLVAALGIAPWCLYARQLYEANRTGIPADVTIGIDHYAVQGATALGIATLAVLAACWPRGRRFTGVSAGLVAAYLGLVSFAWPGTPAAYHGLWSILSVVWGLVVAALATVPPSARAAQS